MDPLVPADLVYSGTKGLTDYVEGVPVDAGHLVLSPTRTYAPIIKKMLESYRANKWNDTLLWRCAKRKYYIFVDGLHVIKDNLFPLPPLFQLIHEQSGTDWKEMYKVFNMGHRMEIYLPAEFAEEVIAVSESFGVDARIISRVEAYEGKKLTIQSEHVSSFTKMLDKLEAIKERFDEVSQLIVDPEIISDMKQYIQLNKEYKDLQPIMEAAQGL